VNLQPGTPLEGLAEEEEEEEGHERRYIEKCVQVKV
jgi:hypothetical protein